MSVVTAYVVVTGCYRPSLRDCTVECSAPSDCSGDQICRDGWCTGESANACEPPSAPDSGTDDAGIADGPLPDADLTRCVLGCTNGTCDANGVCVIDCSATGSCTAADVRCPANVPCRVVCGDNACTKKVICGSATSCDVDCMGSDSCRDEIQCGTIPCDVTCSGATSCHKKTKCSMSCSCDVRCTGAGSCAEIAECPLDGGCLLGRGCSSQVAGCETCP